MARLFISYAREDRPAVEALEAALSRDGHSVWWDHDLSTRAGAFRPQIQQALDAADLVLVAWTARSRASRFVADEADIALSQGKLLSLLIDGARPALGFGAIHGVDLARWSGAADDDEGLQPLRLEIEHRLAGGPQPPAPRPAARSLAAAAGLCAATAVAFGLAQAGVDATVSLADAARVGLGHAAVALGLSVPPAAFAAARSRRLGLSRVRAVARPYLQTLAIGFIVALLTGALALAAGVDAAMPGTARVRQMVSIVLLGTLIVAAVVGGLRWLLLIGRR